MEIDILQFVKIPLVIGVVIVLQIVKSLLEKKGIRPFRDEDTWVWIVLGLGLPMAFIAQGIDGFDSFNIYQFVVNIFVYAAASSFAYKMYKVGGKKVKELFYKGEK